MPDFKTVEEALAHIKTLDTEIQRLKPFEADAQTQIEQLTNTHAAELSNYKDKIAAGEVSVQALQTKLTAAETQLTTVGDTAAQIKTLTAERDGFKTKLTTGLAQRLQAQHGLPEAFVKDKTIDQLEAAESALLAATPRKSNGAVNPKDLGLGGGGSEGNHPATNSLVAATKVIESLKATKK